MILLNLKPDHATLLRLSEGIPEYSGENLPSPYHDIKGQTGSGPLFLSSLHVLLLSLSPQICPLFLSTLCMFPPQSLCSCSSFCMACSTPLSAQPLPSHTPDSYVANFLDSPRLTQQSPSLCHLPQPSYLLLPCFNYSYTYHFIRYFFFTYIFGFFSLFPLDYK